MKLALATKWAERDRLQAKMLANWRRKALLRHPELSMLVYMPRKTGEAGKTGGGLNAVLGIRQGTPTHFLFSPRGGAMGLAIWLTAAPQSEHARTWASALEARGYMVWRGETFDSLRDVLVEYVRATPTQIIDAVADV